MPEEKSRSTGLQWGINLDWFPASSRSAQTLLSSYLCRRCAESLGVKKETRPQALLTAIQGCCAQDPDFIRSGRNRQWMVVAVVAEPGAGGEPRSRSSVHE